MTPYKQFILGKQRTAQSFGFEADSINRQLFGWQAAVVRWAIRRGRAALFADTGLGKSLMQLAWADCIVREQSTRVLLLCPIGVRSQTIREACKFSIESQVVVANSQDDVRGNGIYVTNYEKLHKFDASKFDGVVLDESSLLKNYVSKTKRQLCDTFKDTRFRLACTATPAPNDHMELGNHADWLGVMPSNEMLSRWFINDTMNAGGYRLRKHAVSDFWAWVCSWALCISKPTDVGQQYAADDELYRLPPLETNYVMVDYEEPPPDGSLFATASVSATDLHSVKRGSAGARAAKVRELCDDDEHHIVWCDTDYEADALCRALAGMDYVEVRGSHTESRRESALDAFTSGEKRIIITKPEIAGFGLNWQHCRRVEFVGLSYSYERFYQAVRRSYRFGQTRKVICNVINTEAEQSVLETVLRKQGQHEAMKAHMADAMRATQIANLTGELQREKYQPTLEMEVPAWLSVKA